MRALIYFLLSLIVFSNNSFAEENLADCKQFGNQDPCTFPGQMFMGTCTAPKACINQYQEKQKYLKVTGSTNWTFELAFRNRSPFPVSIAIQSLSCFKETPNIQIRQRGQETLVLKSNLNQGACAVEKFAYVDISAMTDISSISSRLRRKVKSSYIIEKYYRVWLQSSDDATISDNTQRLWTVRNIQKLDTGEVIKDCSGQATNICQLEIVLDNRKN